MKKTCSTLIAATVALSAGVTVAHGQNLVSAFFNNNNGTFTDTQSGLYNWSMATANAVDLEPNNISAGNTMGSGGELPGEETRGRSFMFILPTDGGAPGASLFYTTHLVSTDVQQNNPQPDWYRDGPVGLSGRTVEDLEQIDVRMNSASEVTFHLGLQLNASEWVFSSTNHLVSGSFAVYGFEDLASEQWYTNAFDGSNLDADLSDNALVSIEATDLVTGYAVYADTDTLAGNDARVRLDRMSVTAVPEPSTYAAILGLLVFAGVLRYRRRSS